MAPGPANGFTLDLIGCFERYGELIDWAMLILGPLEPWPGELPLAAAERNGVRVITRVVDYGGLFHDDVLPGHEFPRGDHRGFRPDGWVEAGREKLDRLRPIAERHSLTLLQLACAWNLAHPAVEVRRPDADRGARQPQADRAQARRAGGRAGGLAAERRGGRRDPGDRRQHRLDAAQGRHAGPRGRRGSRPLGARARPDRDGGRWGIDPERDLRKRPP